MRPPLPGSPAGVRGRTGSAPHDRSPGRRGRRCGLARAVSPLLSLPPRPPRPPQPGAKPPALPRGAPLQRRFEEGRVPGLLPRAGVPSGGARDVRPALGGRGPGLPPPHSGPRREGSSGSPRAWPSCHPVPACPVPAPARRGLAALPSRPLGPFHLP